ncbi:biotinidase isoform X2 [Lethenteron reissneri]|uniref:biotinidase isoform X2 n=1 Tax=Lethenteron reissneri TaxID=7753 RepID=UPI002AB62535|nr:biotinidase isoform X2 [Lethenteron reissneri]
MSSGQSHRALFILLLVTAALFALGRGAAPDGAAGRGGDDVGGDDVGGDDVGGDDVGGPRGARGSWFRAAVSEFVSVASPSPTEPRSRREALVHMGMNVAAMGRQAKLARDKGAQIIVFPEYGLFGFGFTRDSILPYLEHVPDPAAIIWNPCLEPDRFPNTEVLRNLSCIARDEGLYVVANMGDVLPCSLDHNTGCPPDGRFQFNTNVAFSSEGTLVARYRKNNLYFEQAFDFPPTVEYSIFDTPFAGRIGLITCFDILFYEPAVALVEKHGVRHIAFPTAWIDQLPLLTSVQIQRAFAYGLNVTLMASNQHHPEKGMVGSGVYGPDVTVYSYDAESNEGRLLVADLPVLSNVLTDAQSGKDDSLAMRGGALQGSKADEVACEMKNSASRNVVGERPDTLNGKPPQGRQKKDRACDDESTPVPLVGADNHGAFVKKEGQSGGSRMADEFYASMMYDNYTFKALQGPAGEVQVCHGVRTGEVLGRGAGELWPARDAGQHAGGLHTARKLQHAARIPLHSGERNAARGAGLVQTGRWRRTIPDGDSHRARTHHG